MLLYVPKTKQTLALLWHLKVLKPQISRKLRPLDPTRALRQAFGPHPLYVLLTLYALFVGS